MYVIERFSDSDFEELGIEMELMKNRFRGLQERALPLIVSQGICKSDCGNWSPEEVREHVLGFGEYCRPLSEWLFELRVDGFALKRTKPESTLQSFDNGLTIADDLGRKSGIFADNKQIRFKKRF